MQFHSVIHPLKILALRAMLTLVRPDYCCFRQFQLARLARWVCTVKHILHLGFENLQQRKSKVHKMAINMLILQGQMAALDQYRIRHSLWTSFSALTTARMIRMSWTTLSQLSIHLVCPDHPELKAQDSTDSTALNHSCFHIPHSRVCEHWQNDCFNRQTLVHSW